MIKRYATLLALSLVCSSVVFYIIITMNIKFVVDTKFTKFDSIVKTIEIKKQKMVLLGLLAESERQLPALIRDQSLSEYEVFSYSLEENEELTENEKVIRSVMQLSSKYVPQLFGSDDLLMYYRSYEGKKIFTHEYIEDFPIAEDHFSIERCSIHETCSIFARSFQLKDRIIVSPVYRDLLTRTYIISLSSPIRNLLTQEIIGDFVVDYRIPYIWAKGFNFRTEKTNTYKTTFFEHLNFPLQDYSYMKEHIIDNRTKFVYKLPVTLIIYEYSWIWLILFLSFYFVLWKWDDSRYSRNQLKEVLISANEDELTGLFNRKIFNEESFIHNISDNGASVIAIDGNRIKRINDLHGHAVGDMAILHIAESMRNVFREDDYLIRNGGDEFIAVLPSCSLEDAEKFAELLKDEVTANAIEPFNTHVSIATGVTLKLEFESIKSAILRADENLYLDKQIQSQKKKARRNGNG